LIDRLPPNSFTTAALMDDEEYAEMVIQARERAEKTGERGPDPGPSLAWWTPEVNGIAALIDKVSMLIELQKSEPKRPERYARPKTRVDRLTAERENADRWAAHADLTARVIQNPPAAGQ